MSQNPITIKHLRNLIEKGEAKDPLVFLESVMSGQDPRKLSAIYELIVDLDSFSGDISKNDWHQVVDLVMNNFKYHTVPLSESIVASKALAEYIYPKRKHIDINGDRLGTASVADNPLTQEEIELFKEKFNDDF